MRILKLMTDYQCFPLWELTPGMVGNVNPASLPISDVLQKKLLILAASYDATLNMDGPVKSGFHSVDAENDFIALAKELAINLQEELGDSFFVSMWKGDAS